MDATRFYPNPALTDPSLLLVPPRSEGKSSRRITAEVAEKLGRDCVHRAGLVSTPGSSQPHSSSSPLGSLYVGRLGLVYLRFRLSQWLLLRQKSSTTPSSSSGARPGNGDTAAAQQWRSEALELLESSPDMGEGDGNHQAETIRRVTLLEGPEVGARALHAILLFHNGEAERARRVAHNLLRILDQSCRPLPRSECDVLYGRAGALQAAFWLRRELQDPTMGSDLVVRLATEIVQEGKRHALQHPEAGMPLLWTWHESWYLGAAHGVSGILHSLLALESAELQHIDGRMGGGLHVDIQATIDKMQQYCFESGNLDSSIHIGARKRRTDRLVHWCHGAPGYILLLLQAFRVYSHREDFLQRAKTVADNVVWPRGLLRKGVGLCHGIAGNAYALLELGRYDMRYAQQAEYFANFAIDHLGELEPVPDRPYSLYEGLAGLCVLAMDLVSPADDVRFPLYF